MSSSVAVALGCAGPNEAVALAAFVVEEVGVDRRGEAWVVELEAEIGAAWAKRSNEGRDYLGLKLDDPSFTAPIYANLFDDEGGEGYSLIWSRASKRNGD